MIRDYIKYGLRNLYKNKTHASINIIGLAIGIAAFIIITLYIQYENSYDKFNKNYNQIYRVQLLAKLSNGEKEISQTYYPIGRILKERFPEVKEVAELRSTWGEYLSVNKDISFYETNGYFASNNIFEVFSFEFIRGSKENALSEPFSIVLTETYAKKLFLDQDPLGKVIHADNNLNYKVTAIIKDIPRNSHINPAYFVSFKSFKGKFNWETSNDWYSIHISTYILLHEHKLGKELEKKISNLLNEFIPNNNKTLYLKPLPEIYLQPTNDRGPSLLIYYYSFIALFTIIMACINYINLTTAFASSRRKEIAVRKIVGSNKRSLRIRFLVESVIIAVISTIIAIILARLFLPTFNLIINEQLELSLIGSWKFLVFIIASGVVIGFLSGMYPAFYISSFPAISILSNNISLFYLSNKVFNTIKIRKILVSIQFTISIFLIFLTLFIFNQLNFMKEKEVGFDTNNVLTCFIRGQGINSNFEDIKDKLLQLPDISFATISDNLPFYGSNGKEIKWEGSGNDKLYIKTNRVGYNFIDTYGLKMLRGRNFSKEFPADQKEACIINETALKLFGWEDPIGRKIDDNKYTIIGVVKDFHMESVVFPISPLFLTLHSGELNNNNFYSIKVTTKDVEKTKSNIKKDFTIFFPNNLFEFKTFNENLNDNLMDFIEGIGKSFVFFCLLSIIISIIGLFGLIIYITKQRTKEIGLRKAFGASIQQIYFMLLGELLKMLMISIIIALPMGYLVYTKMPTAYKYNIRVEDFIIVAAIDLVVVLITTFYHIVKVSRTNPVDSLKYE